ncbi:MAG: polysaccharide biosynthesis tyrosine autokinase [Bacteroidales bacterium]|nr:polysaccharide biosynthesis tyrosine autokinase [Bacteroidales bacterium]
MITDNQIDFQPERYNIKSREKNKNDLQIFLPIILKKWYWFIIALVLALAIVRFYIGHTLPVYQTSATILINETGERSFFDNSEILQGLGLPGGMRNVQNQIMILKSIALTESTLKELSFEIEYYLRTIRNILPLYPENPVRIISDTEIPLPKDTEFSLSFHDKNIFTLECEADYFPLQKTASFGEEIAVPGGSFRIECRNDEWVSLNKDKLLYFIIHKRESLVGNFAQRIKVELVARDGSILRVSMLGTNPEKDVDFLNKHLESFQAISLNKKNSEAIRRIQFIEDQLVGISDSLSITENRLQQFRSSHRVMDLSAQGQSIIGQITLLENERARLNLEANYYDYLADYLAKDATGEIPIVPITMGITDPGLTRLVEELAELQGQLSTTGAGEMNPLQRNLALRVRSAKDALRETLNGLRRANGLARAENQEQINKSNAQASALPVTERQLLGIERKFRLNDELYTFLLETRAQQEMQKASNRADSEIIDPADARFSTIVAPDRMKLSIIALFAGFALPLAIIFLQFLFNTKLKEEDIKTMTEVPIVGYIPHNTDKSNTVVFDNPNSIISESFRLMRSRMQFFTKDNISTVILVTSTAPSEGKTFTAINIASAYSLLGKKTVLIGFDLRNPKIFQDFNLSNETGVSTWLIGKDKLQDIIQGTSYDNFWVISSGPIPPNPSELTALEKTEELLKLLKEKYDYIIIDSSPIGIVSDTYYLAALADACLLVVRPGQTLKDMFESTLKEIKTNSTKGTSLVINDVSSDSKHYGYGQKYGYVKGKRSTHKASAMRK